MLFRKEKEVLVIYKFLTNDHEIWFEELCKRDQAHIKDYERRALFYVISGNGTLYKNVNSIYDFEDNSIRLEVFNEPFLTGGTRCLINLAFNLYNASSADCSINHLFSPLDEKNRKLAIQAIKLRFNIPVG